MHPRPLVTWLSELWSCWGQGALWRSNQVHFTNNLLRGVGRMCFHCVAQRLHLSAGKVGPCAPPSPHTETVRWLQPSLIGQDSNAQRPDIPSTCYRSQIHQEEQKLTSKGSRRRRGDGQRDILLASYICWVDKFRIQRAICLFISKTVEGSSLLLTPLPCVDINSFIAHL